MKDGWRWPNFSPEEVLSPDGITQLGQRNIMLIAPSLLDALEEFRVIVDAPLYINFDKLKYRGYRSPFENYKVVKGETYSFHMQGLAVDVSSPIGVDKLHELALSFDKWQGVGYYPTRGFCHLDMRPSLNGNRTTWKL